ncbi:MAG: hypothetical protein Q9219_004265 [cf. Caloplaca sp. 3 TL-2023]
MIQAKSLSNVVDLADNPHSAPDTGLEILDPLILYIARVPGSRDVFLTTIKPLEKVVTAQDVQSSLYYVHVDSPEEDGLRRSIDSMHVNELKLSTTGNGMPTTGTAETSPRKAVGRSRYTTTTSNIGPHYQTSPLNSPKMMHVTRKAVPHHIQPEVEAPYKGSRSPNARVMGPRAMHPRLHSDDPGLGHEPSCGKENLMLRRWSEQHPLLPSQSSPSRGFREVAPNIEDRGVYKAEHKAIQKDDRSMDRCQKHNTMSTSCFERSRPSTHLDHSLTLIRRYDGSQSNVARVFSDYDLCSVSGNHSTSRQDNLSIQINTAGHDRFRHPNASEESAVPEQPFERLLSRSLRNSQASGLTENDTNAVNQRKSRMSIDFRRWSKTSLGSSSGNSRSSQPLPAEHPSSNKSYGFYSPWNGLCEFTSNISGHALKCRHTPLYDDSKTVTVSELRFNLPSSGNSNVNSPRDVESLGRPKITERSSYFSSGSDTIPLKNPIPESGRHDEQSRPFSLSLGREHAGGGFGGKQAKLGKLIIEPEGLKMLDLLVAANIGLWWKVYEKSA